MKRKTKVAFALTILTMLLCCLFLSGCGCKQHVGVGKCTECGADFFELLAKHCKKNGELKSGMYSIVYLPPQSSDEFACLILSYDPSDDEISMFFQYEESNIMITINEINGRYSYYFGDTVSSGKEYTLRGTFNASLLSDLSSLPYTYSSANSLLTPLLANLACTTAQLLFQTADPYFIENDMPIRSVNLGFYE